MRAIESKTILNLNLQCFDLMRTACGKKNDLMSHSKLDQLFERL